MEHDQAENNLPKVEDAWEATRDYGSLVRSGQKIEIVSAPRLLKASDAFLRIEVSIYVDGSKRYLGGRGWATRCPNLMNLWDEIFWATQNPHTKAMVWGDILNDFLDMHPEYSSPQQRLTCAC